MAERDSEQAKTQIEKGEPMTLVMGDLGRGYEIEPYINASILGGRDGAPPVISIGGDTLPEVWEKGVLACWLYGARIPTQYDKLGDPPSRDCIMTMTVHDPFAEPRIHKCMPGGLMELFTYVKEVVEGVHDHWIDPKAGKWEYTYHERLAAYSVSGLDQVINQLEYVVEILCEAPHTRRAQAVIWKPLEDAGIDDPACLQRLWFRIFEDQLILNCHIRSNDAYKAAFMNMYAFTELQKVVAAQVSQRLGRVIKPGQYTHFADSFHIYGSYFQELKGGFLIPLQKRPWGERVWRSDDPNILHERNDALEKIRRESEV